MEELHPYEKYKDSQHKCLNKIPLDWIETKVKHLFNIGRGRVISQLELNPDGLYPVYSSQTKYDGCLGYIDTYDFNVQEMITWTTDGANAGEVFKRSGRFNCTNVCGTLIPKQSLNIDYFHYLLGYMTQFYKRPDTNGAKIMNNEMADIYIVMPSLLEQQKIATYLDYTTSKVDAIIKQKETLVERLEEKRAAIINEAVTKGLNPDAPMEDSGIDWLGEIPAHWILRRLRYLCRITTGNKDTENKVEGGLYPFYVRSQNIERINSFSYDGEAILTAGDGVGVCKVWHYVNEKFDFHQRVYMLYEFKDIIGKHLFNYMQSNFINDVLKLSAKSTVDSLRLPMFQNFLVAFPFDKHEQQEIVDYISYKTNIIDTITSELKIQIEKLKEYRQSVIADAVTGKVDLRNWQEPLN